jgi:hypothetical protein
MGLGSELGFGTGSGSGSGSGSTGDKFGVVRLSLRKKVLRKSTFASSTTRPLMTAPKEVLGFLGFLGFLGLGLGFVFELEWGLVVLGLGIEGKG